MTCSSVIRTFLAISAAAAVLLPGMATASEEDSEESFLSELPVEIHGFYEMRAGYRLRKDKYEKDMSIMENRFQLDLFSLLDWGDIRFRGDVYGDLVTEKGFFDMREANVFLRPLDYMDLKAGRQILTWGTGDLIFVNDLFPKDWQSFFIGRDTEYLKAPSDAAKVSLFGDWANLDIVYTPRFDHDRFISGQRISYWNSNLGRLAGQDAIVHTDKPNEWFRDSEIAGRLYKNIENYELAFYGYHGFWKSPGGQTATMTQATFPDLNVYGTSLRGSVAKGIGNVEFAYYESADDQNGRNALVNNSEARYLIGYTQEIGKDLTMGLQYYLEQMLDYGRYRNSLAPGVAARDEYRHLTTLRLTKLLMNQNLRCSLFTYYSPSDADVYLRPNVNYKVSDNLTVEAGANVFFGDHRHTFFGQFQNDTNIYTGMRYSF
ncbi:MAG: hypothetical protein JSW59_20380 [Phycisphaerales bacterium]|nr:MAG: hypothetical protein JSW59_20380 [Phycisphaerales bacterium]